LEKAGGNFKIWRYIMISPYQGSYEEIRNKFSSGKISSWIISSSQGNSDINSANTKYFLDLADMNWI